MDSSIYIIIATILLFLFAITIHEFSHGWIAYKCGDNTAMSMGRLTLNPLSHIDIFGTVILPLLLLFSGLPPFGYAKPVPVNFGNLGNPKRDMIWVAIAGPASNIVAAVAIALILKVLHISFSSVAGKVLFYGMVINLYLAIFNLFPIPPLDGSRVVTGLLPYRYAVPYNKIEPFGFLIILGLFYFGILQRILTPIVILFLKFMGFGNVMH
ncbi:MAG: site-2 protease family protein [Candidatus Ancaeobacter aquaticus]|nr:site-2 protease family protein [Candidatus Ancaeobacter aquaticus]